MISKLPLVSIIIPAYNCELYIERCLESIISQTYKKIEIIVIDDGSQDNTSVICDTIAMREKRMSVVHQENSGVSISRNKGLELARGEYILFSDADDWYETDAVCNLVECIEENDSDMVLGNILHWDGTIIESMRPKLSAGVITLKEFMVSYILIYKTEHMIGAPFAKLYKKRIIDEYKVRYESEESYAEDFMFNIQYYMHCKKLAIVDGAVYNYRVESPGSLSKRNIMFYNKMLNRQKVMLNGLCELAKIADVNVNLVKDVFSLYFCTRLLRIMIRSGEKNTSLYTVYNNYSAICMKTSYIDGYFWGRVDKLFVKMFILTIKFKPLVYITMCRIVMSVGKVLKAQKR